MSYVAASLGVGSPNLSVPVDRFAVTPDGGTIVLVGPHDSGLFVRHRSNPDAVPLAGAPPGAFLPVVSPNGQWVAFFSEQSLWKIPIGGGTPMHLLNTIARSGMTWGADDRLRFPSIGSNAIESIPASGGAIESIAIPSDIRLQRAEWLPNGRLLLSITHGAQEAIAVREPDGTLRNLTSGRYAKVPLVLLERRRCSRVMCPSITRCPLR